MLEGIHPTSISGTAKMSDKVEAAIKNIELFIDNVESYDDTLELLTLYALPQLQDVKARLKKGVSV